MSKSQLLQGTAKLLLFALLSLLPSILILFTYPFFEYYYTNFPYYNFDKTRVSSSYHVPEKNYCDIFSGNWVPSLEAPYYTNSTCKNIYQNQNCLKNRRPDSEFLKWRWKPSEPGCGLPVFDPARFLEIVRGKSLAFVGDSLARNHMESLLCMLSKVEVVSKERDEGSRSEHYKYRNHNFTIEIFWSPYLVKTTQTVPNDSSKPYNVYLDEFDKDWTGKIESFDYIIISAGQWFVRTNFFYLNDQLIGCLWCDQKDITHLREDFGLEMAYNTALKAIYNTENYKVSAFVRTYATSHFENGTWTGYCARTRPYGENETRLENISLNIYNAQIKEFKKAEKIGNRLGIKFRLIDVTRAMLRRPDGHPGKYHGNLNTKWISDCVHWCLPGPVDTWNEILLEILERDQD